MKNKPFGPHEEFILNPDITSDGLINAIEARLSRVNVIAELISWDSHDEVDQGDLDTIGWMLKQLALEIKQFTGSMSQKLWEYETDKAA